MNLPPIDMWSFITHFGLALFGIYILIICLTIGQHHDNKKKQALIEKEDVPYDRYNDF